MYSGGGSTLCSVPHDTHSLLVGAPAKPVRGNISWSSDAPRDDTFRSSNQ